MKKVFITLSGLVALIFILLVAAIAYIATFDPNANKDWITAKFRDATGRELSLGGEIGLTLYPWLGLTLNDVTVGNAAGFSSTPLLQAERAEVRVKLMPLFNSSYEIDTVRLHGAHLNLEVLGNGQANWADPAAAATPADDSAAEDSASSGTVLNNLIVGGVDIQNTSLVYDDQFANTHYEVSDLNVTIGELVYGEPLDIRMNLDASSRNPELAAALNLSGTVVYDVDNGRYDLNPLTLQATLRGPNVPTGSADVALTTALSMNLEEDTLSLSNLEFSALDTRLTAGIEASRVQTDTPTVAATFNLQGEDLAALFRILEQNELAQRISSLNSSFDITASVDADMGTGTVTVPTLEASLLGADINGSLNASRINSDTPAVNGNLSASGPDLPTLIEVVGMLQGGSDSALSQYGRELGRVPDKTFRVQTNFDADLQSGNLAVPELYISLLGATVNGNVTGSRIQTETPQLSGQLNAQGPDLPLLLQIVGQLQGGQGAALNQYGQQLRNGVQNRAFTLSTNFDADLERGNIQLPALTAAMLGFRLNGNLDAQNMQGNNGNVSGALTLEGENLGEVLRALDQAGLADVAQALNLNLQVSGNSGNLRVSPFNLSMVLSGPQIANSPQTLAFNADTVANLDNDSLNVDAFSLTGLGLNLTGAVSASNLSENLSFAGRLDLPAFNARELLRQLNQEVPPTNDDSVLQNVSLATTFAGTANSIDLDDLAIRLDDTSITGSLAVSDFATQATRFTVNIDRLDADRYLAPVPASAATPAPASPSVSNSDSSTASSAASPLPVDALQALNVQGALNIGELTISGLDMSNIVVELNAANGDVALNPVSASLYEGSFAGDIHLNVNGAQPSATVATTLSAINLEPLLQDFMDATYLTGKGNIQLSLSGSGADTAAIKSNLNGSGSINLEDGVLTGVDVADALGRIETMIRERRLVELPQGGTTPFDNFSATLAVDNGVVGSNDLLIKAPGWQLTGAGTLVNLGNDSIDFNMVTTVDPTTAPANQQYDLSGHTLPIACTGSISSPRCLPDAQQIITAAVGNVVQERLGEFLQDRFGTAQPQTGQPQEQQESTDGTTGTTEENDDAAPPEQEPAAPAEQLINRALDRLLR